MKVDAVATLGAPGRSWHNFIRHFIEMVVAMIAGMAILGGLLSLSFALVGHANPVHYAGLRALVMTINMTIGMSLWMRHRHHDWGSISEMAGAMFLPLIVLIGPYWAGLLSGGALLSVMHVLMLPCMLAAMLYRREEYAQDHRRHSPSQPRLAQRIRTA
jgi:flagellar biosynthetic protein FliP